MTSGLGCLDLDFHGSPASEHAGYVLRKISDLDEAGLDAELETCRACMKILCDRYELSVHMAKVSQFRRVTAGSAERPVLEFGFNEQVCDPPFMANVFALSRRGTMEKLAVYDKSSVPTEAELLWLLRMDASSDVLSAHSLLDGMLHPRYSRIAERSEEKFELCTYMMLEHVFSSNLYWVVAPDGGDHRIDGRLVPSFKVLDGKTPAFCPRPEFDLRMKAEGMPEFRRVEAELDQKEKGARQWMTLGSD